MRGQTRQHRRTENMRHVEHHGIRPPAIDKGLQLIFQVLGLLSCKSRHGKGPTKPLPRHPVAGLAIGDLGLKFSLRNGGRALVLSVSRRGKNNRQDCCLQY